MSAPIAKLIKELRIKSAMMNMGEKIAWGSDTALMDEAAAALASFQEEIERLRKALEPFGRPNDIDPSLPDSTWLGVKYEDVFVAHCHAGDFRRAARALSPSEEQADQAPKSEHGGCG